MNIQKSYDVVVIGGGPAGALASSLLSKEGFSILLLEKDECPVVKVGESLIPHFWRYLDLIGASQDVIDEGFIAKAGGSTLWNEKFQSMSFADFSYKRPGLHVERDRFDEIILNKCRSFGTQVVRGVKATKWLSNSDGDEIHYKYVETGEVGIVKAKYVIDASGQNAMISSQEGTRVYDDGFRFHAYWGYYTGGHYLNKDAKFTPFGNQSTIRPLTLVSSIGNWGWVWHITLRESTSIGLILPKESISKFKSLGQNISERFESSVSETPLIGELMSSAKLKDNSVSSIKDYAYKQTHLTIDNSFLVGDAAAFVDPINSAGVVTALYGAYLASHVIKRSLQNPNRQLHFKKIYHNNLKLRLDLYRLLAFPTDLLSPEVIADGQNLLSQLSDIEKSLAMTQIILTNRAKNLPALLNITASNYCKEMPLEEIMSSAFS